MRKLASIQKIKDIQPIEGADRIEVVSFESIAWRCVTRKNEFDVGDWAIYLEIDSVLPFAPWSEFLRNKDKPNKPIRLKTVRLRGCLSQGLALPLIAWDGFESLPNIEEGMDLTEVLGVTKYEPPVAANLAGQVRNSFPSHLPKTDEERIQSSPALLDELRGLQCQSAVKCDGTSVTFARIDGDEPIHVCSRNLSLKDGNNVYWDMFRKYDIEEKLNSLDKPFGIQAEVVGPGIQKNRMGLEQIEMKVFDIRDIEAGRYLDPEDMLEFCRKFELPTVPIDVPSFVFDFTVEELLEMAKGKYENGHVREGIVIRPLKSVYSYTLSSRLSVKVINNDYLLKTGE